MAGADRVRSRPARVGQQTASTHQRGQAGNRAWCRRGGYTRGCGRVVVRFSADSAHKYPHAPKSHVRAGPRPPPLCSLPWRVAEASWVRLRQAVAGRRSPTFPHTPSACKRSKALSRMRALRRARYPASPPAARRARQRLRAVGGGWMARRRGLPNSLPGWEGCFETQRNDVVGAKDPKRSNQDHGGAVPPREPKPAANMRRATSKPKSGGRTSAAGAPATPSRGAAALSWRAPTSD